MREKTGRRMVFALVSVFLLLIGSFFVLSGAGETFDFSPNPNGNIYQVDEDEPFLYDLNVSVNESSVNYSMETNPYAGSMLLNVDTGLINFTPDNDDVGLYGPGILFIARNTSRPADYATSLVYFNITNVNDAPNVTSNHPVNLTVNMSEDSSMNFNITAMDVDIQHGDLVRFVWLLDSTINQSSGYNTTLVSNFTYHTDFLSAGIHEVVAMVYDLDSSTGNVTWSVNVSDKNRPPVFNGTIANYSNFEDNITYNWVLLTDYFSDVDTDNNLSCYAVNSSYVNLSVDHNTINSTLNVTVIPFLDWNGNQTNVYFECNDSYDSVRSNNFILFILPVNDAPVVQNITGQTAYKNVSFSLQVAASDVDGDNLSYYDNSSLFVINITSGLISFFPLEVDIGNHSINITVDDDTVNTSVNFMLYVMNNTAPLISPVNDHNATEGVAYELFVNATDPENDTMNFTADYSRFQQDDPYYVGNYSVVKFYFTPSDSDSGLIHHINITVVDSKGASSIESFFLNVIDTNNMPYFIDIQNYLIKINTTLELYLTANDSDNDDLYFADNVTEFNISKYNINTALINFTPSQIGIISVNVSVNDTALFNWSTFILNVTYNHLPVLVLEDKNVTEDDEFYYVVNASDSDWQDTLYYYDDTNLFNIDADGIINFTPDYSDVGDYTILINVSDGENMTWSTFNLSIEPLNDPPEFWDLRNYTTMEGLLTTIYVSAYDEEEPYISMLITFLNGTALFNYTQINESTLLINFTPTNAQAGNPSNVYNLNFSVWDNTTNVTDTVTMTIYDQNNYPNVTDYYFNTTNVSLSEDNTYYFNISYFDVDGDDLTIIWYYDNVVNKTESNNASLNYSVWSYTPNFYSAGSHNLTVQIMDDGIFNLSRNVSWNLSVNNTNRLPKFGVKHFEGDGLTGSFTNVEVVNNTLRLVTNGSGYAARGIFISDPVDMGMDTSSKPYFNFTTFNYTYVTPSGTVIRVGTRGSDSSSFTNTTWDGVVSDEITSEDKRYIRFFINMSTTNLSNTPILSSTSLNYEIADRDSNAVSASWIYLTQFFSDLDSDDVLNYSYSKTAGLGNLCVVINDDEPNVRVELIPANNNMNGNITFSMTDSYGTVYSNPVHLEFFETDNEASSVEYIRSGGGTNTIIQTEIKIKTVKENVSVPKFLELVASEASTMDPNGTLYVPVIVKNNDNTTIYDVFLKAFTTNELIDMHFVKDKWVQIRPGVQEKTILVVESYKTYGAYEIWINVTSKSPAYGDTAHLFISSLELGGKNLSAYNTKITFVRDLISGNVECLELDALLQEADTAVNQKEYARAIELLDTAAEGCRYLISLKRDPWEEKPFKEKIVDILRLNKAFSAIAIAIALMILLLVVWAIKPIRKAKKEKEAQEEETDDESYKRRKR